MIRRALLALLLTAMTEAVLAGTLTVEVHASFVDDGTYDGYVGSLGQYYWQRSWWEQYDPFSFGVTHLLGSEYWSGTLSSDSWSHYLRFENAQEGECYSAELAVQVFKAGELIDSGWGGSDPACVTVFCNLYVWRILEGGSFSPAPPTGRYACGTTLMLWADPDPGWQFDGWTGDVESSSTTIYVTLYGDKSIFANFSRIPPPDDPPCTGEECGDGDEESEPPQPCDAGNGICSPIVVDVNGDGLTLTGVGYGVFFDLNADGRRDRVSWTAAGTDDAFLWLDSNGNGAVDDGAELFGDARNRNGFEKLSLFDSDGNEVIDRFDGVWQQLLLWRDANHNGISEPEEIAPWSSSRFVGIDLRYQTIGKRDKHGNWFRYKSRLFTSDNSSRHEILYDVLLVRIP